MILDKKPTLQVYKKSDITYDLFHKIIHNSYLAQKTIQTAIDDIKIKVPKGMRRIAEAIEYALISSCCYRLI